MPATRLTSNSKKSSKSALPAIPHVRGMGAWLAVVRTYQQCSETLSEGIKPLGLKLAQHDVMMNLLQSNSLTQQELAQRSFVTKSHMSAVLMEMAELGWISREGSEMDKRSKVITLSAQGQELASQAFAVQAQVVNVMMGDLSNTQIEEIQDFSLNAYEALAQHRVSMQD
ncbi:MarR family transcriptional regulator [Variovorax sp. PCZ-1]|uniref:MarR family winged helix-turn-helix transcriptional regulator n=1 Tax=Variovorax sp. PCZ-1 TaxID=2835533 RepID=UPI001BCC4B6A|nr:MarR family transcriptional regulator [Variovorax sp. PCZ-1]MBS7807387.1 MarR family transcriptional regulator [Variovorax sp. PCZ-1]